ncbi:hypothetical protein PROFUN_05497 [Planoprotostelium fungivorum]|uniref:Uncharacterized protein n=1 Tax=Planoprotostelium fungivorum TaxID=1890364 RepID=A0A2P6NQV8_9EUKA|nr:hypothetical protein PROFUN_05497 [Planoprotostelium fungivorum]
MRAFNLFGISLGTPQELPVFGPTPRPDLQWNLSSYRINTSRRTSCTREKTRTFCSPFEDEHRLLSLSWRCEVTRLLPGVRPTNEREMYGQYCLRAENCMSLDRPHRRGYTKVIDSGRSGDTLSRASTRKAGECLTRLWCTGYGRTQPR